MLIVKAESDLVGAAIVFPDEKEKNFPWSVEYNLDTPCWNERTNAFYRKLGYSVIRIEDGFVFYRKRKSEPDTIQHFS